MSVSGPHVEPPSSPCLTAQEGICQLLGLVFRLHAASSKAVQGGGGGGGGSGLSSTTLLGTAAATARQVSISRGRGGKGRRRRQRVLLDDAAHDRSVCITVFRRVGRKLGRAMPSFYMNVHTSVHPYNNHCTSSSGTFLSLSAGRRSGLRPRGSAGLGAPRPRLRDPHRSWFRPRPAAAAAAAPGHAA